MTEEELKWEKIEWVLKGKLTIMGRGVWSKKEPKGFHSVYAPKLRGVLIKTKEGLWFKDRDRALASGKRWMERMKNELGTFTDVEKGS